MTSRPSVSDVDPYHVSLSKWNKRGCRKTSSLSVFYIPYLLTNKQSSDNPILHREGLEWLQQETVGIQNKV